MEWCCYLVSKSCLTRLKSRDCSPPGSSVHGISQTRMLESAAISFSRGFSQPDDWTWVSYTGRQILYRWTTAEAHDGILPRHKKEWTGALPEAWMDLEIFMQSEVNQKEKNKRHIPMCVCGIEKSGIGDVICKTEIETQTKRANVSTPRGTWEGLLSWETGIGYVHSWYYV